MIDYHLERPEPKQMLSKSLIIGALSTVGWLLGLVPALDVSNTLEFETSAYAQEFNQAQVNAFARSILEIELAREATQQQNPGTAQNFECDIASGRVININSFASEIRQPIQSLCNQSQSILQQNRLSAAQFRQMKNRYDRNPQQYPQITAAFGTLCQQNKYKKLQVCR
ncbi:MAG: DUF4168 domain-containing protein [Hormoscilla sp. GUM202]|nr:DUF4168 domain-containing protein [Hormoscilla sp. GUM202]